CQRASLRVCLWRVECCELPLLVDRPAVCLGAVWFCCGYFFFGLYLRVHGRERAWAEGRGRPSIALDRTPQRRLDANKSRWVILNRYCYQSGEVAFSWSRVAARSTHVRICRL